MFQVQSFEWSHICDDFFLVKLEFFYHLISDCTCSTVNFRTFSLRPEQTIFLFQTLPVSSSTCSGGAIPPFTSVVRFPATSTNCVSAVTTDTIPLENAWFLLLGFQITEGTFMPVEEFLTRLQMTNQVTRACKLKAEGIHSGKKVERSLVQKTASTMKTEFVRDGQAYLQYLIGEVLRQAGLSSNIVKGLAAFDTFIVLRRPTEVTLRHFDVLYSTFMGDSFQ